ncbi:hypothetical protein TrRE_jg7958 [Triparma retinervis]|jgi:hypothetical protein|uniref:Uncharacterized protein n=1 Tax=Triparma retinervis TaxID=2557542 RepID=A0A9W7DP89_9STRA|nr:hypothetical protein TrRE_jg7958 [Triparma retinervis]
MSSFTSDASPLLAEEAPFQFDLTTFEAFVADLESNLDLEVVAGAGDRPEDKRAKVLELQIEVLESHSPDIGAGRAALGKLDSATFGPLMDRMNLAVSCAYVRGLLRGKPEVLKESGEITREECITFLDACVAMLDLRETSDVLRQEFKKAKFGTQQVVDGAVRSGDGASGMRLVHEELVRMQTNMLECCGLQGDFGVSQLGIARTTFAGDNEVLKKLDTFIERMAKAGSDVLEFYGEGGVSSLADKVSMQDDGTTRVVKVSHKEVDTSAPAADRGDVEMKEREQRKQINMARQMAVMQQDILAELLSWDEEERKEQLQFCKQIRDEFVQQAMSVPPAQRAEFMTTVNPDLQRRLIMLKLWDEMVAKNGGVAPDIKKAKGANPPVDKIEGSEGGEGGGRSIAR